RGRELRLHAGRAAGGVGRARGRNPDVLRPNARAARVPWHGAIRRRVLPHGLGHRAPWAVSPVLHGAHGRGDRLRGGRPAVRAGRGAALTSPPSPLSTLSSPPFPLSTLWSSPPDPLSTLWRGGTD